MRNRWGLLPYRPTTVCVHILLTITREKYIIVHTVKSARQWGAHYPEARAREAWVAISPRWRFGLVVRTPCADCEGGAKGAGQGGVGLFGGGRLLQTTLRQQLNKNKYLIIATLR